MKRFAVPALAAALMGALGGAASAAATKPPEIPPNGAPVVRVNSTNQSYDYARPWEKKSPFPRRGTGAILGDGRVLVTAELVANHNFVELEKPRTGEKTPATVVAVDYDSNLALLESADPAFLEPLGFFPLAASARVGDEAEILQVESNGEIARTPAKVTTIAVAPYPMETALLLFRMSAPLQGRDSSFVLPAERDGRLLGLLMRYDARSQTADIIPPPVISQFLSRVAARVAPGIPRAGLSFASTRDPRLRDFIGMEEPGGIYVTEVLADSPAEAAGLRRGDVILAVAGRDLDSDGLYDDPLFGKILFSQLVSSAAPGGEVPLQILRDGAESDVTVVPAVEDPAEAASPPHLFDRPPRYLVLGGLVFQELSRNFLREWGANWRKTAPQRLVYLDATQSELPPDRGKIVFLSAILPSEDTLGYEGLENLVVTRVNGHTIRGLDDLLKATASSDDAFHKIEFEEDPGFIILDARRVTENQEALAGHYGIPAMHNLGD
jgi:S1-C subfamily serine protease